MYYVVVSTRYPEHVEAADRVTGADTFNQVLTTYLPNAVYAVQLRLAKHLRVPEGEVHAGLERLFAPGIVGKLALSTEKTPCYVWRGECYERRSRPFGNSGLHPSCGVPSRPAAVCQEVRAGLAARAATPGRHRLVTSIRHGDSTHRHAWNKRLAESSWRGATRHSAPQSGRPGIMRGAGYGSASRAIAGSTHRTHGHRDQP
jgi:hypothetical protein